MLWRFIRNAITIETALKWFELKEEDAEDRARWRYLVELAIRQKPATHTDKSGMR